jgi:BolA family transcriptional regulator, general stress-responsive regulator
MTPGSASAQPANELEQGVSAAGITARLQAALQPSMLSVLDESADHAGHAGSNGQGHGTHFRVRLGAPSFEGKSLVACHRMVYAALGAEFAAGLHALAIEVQR